MRVLDLVLGSRRGLLGGLCLLAVVIGPPAGGDAVATEGAAAARSGSSSLLVCSGAAGAVGAAGAAGERHSGEFAHGTPEVPAAVKEQVERDLADYLRGSTRSSAPTAPSARSAVDPDPVDSDPVDPDPVDPDPVDPDPVDPDPVDPLPATVVVPVRIHIIRGAEVDDRIVTRAQARQVVASLRDGFSGGQDPGMAATGIRFVLRSVDVTRNDRWFRASPGSRADRAMHRSLHRGTREALNIYLSSPTSRGGALLGIARFPWLAGRAPRLDGVTVNVATLPGGRARGYSLGDTVIHEVGHWLGLFHTFEGGCETPGDYVSDTAPEARPSYACERGRDTCPSERPAAWVEGDPVPAPVPDPVQNFMDYSFDRCMNHFTPGQRDRAVAAFMRYRFER